MQQAATAYAHGEWAEAERVCRKILAAQGEYLDALSLFVHQYAACNAHSTASDASWAGLPVLTRIGESFAARVAASLLNAIGLPELVTTTQEQYESTAIELASDLGRLAEFKDRLHRNRLTMPLFDTEQFTRHIENAYTQMYERYQADLSAEHIYVARLRQYCALNG